MVYELYLKRLFLKREEYTILFLPDEQKLKSLTILCAGEDVER